MFTHNEDKFRISGPAVFDWQLVAENKACLDHAALMGMRKTPSDCAMACYSSAEYFSFGECSGGLCKCHCHKEGYDNTCTAFDHRYNLYSYAEPGKFCSANLLRPPFKLNCHILTKFDIFLLANCARTLSNFYVSAC